MSRFASAVLTVLLAAPLAAADDAPLPVGVDPKTVIARVRFRTDDNTILVPVKFGGKVHLFQLDTGASMSAVDRPLLAAAEGDTGTALTSTGDVRAFERFRMPAGATVGPLPLDGMVIGIDCGPFRAAFGDSIEGVLGLDFLARHVVHVDFDRGEVLFLRSGGPAWGTPVPIKFGTDSAAIPSVTAAVDGAGDVEFGVDTGFAGTCSGSLPVATYNALVIAGKMRTVSATRSVSLGGVSNYPVGQGGRLAVGPFTVAAAVYQGAGLPLLGNGFWSRFAVTFDFPNRLMYLRPGKQYQRADAWNRSGVSVTAQKDKVVVRYTVDGGPGQSAGVGVGDELRSVGGLAVTPDKLPTLRRALAGTGTVTCVFRRDGVDRTVTLDLGR